MPIFNLGGTPVDPSDPAAGPDDAAGVSAEPVTRGKRPLWLAALAAPILVAVKAVDPAKYPFYGRVDLAGGAALPAALVVAATTTLPSRPSTSSFTSPAGSPDLSEAACTNTSSP